MLRKAGEAGARMKRYLVAMIEGLEPVLEVILIVRLPVLLFDLRLNGWRCFVKL